jgi:hypothetical protein
MGKVFVPWLEWETAPEWWELESPFPFRWQWESAYLEFRSVSA